MRQHRQRELIHRSGIRLRKGLGQHFLVDRGVLQEIVRRAAVQPDETILEVGSGVGSLTFALAREAQRVVALERDERLYSLLRDHLGSYPNVELIRADALSFDYSVLGSGWKVVSNLPYSVSTPLLFRFLQHRQRITEMVLMLQREVADRLVSLPSRKAYGSLSVAIQLYCQVERCLRVSPSAFWPRPRVESSVIHFRFLEKPRVKLTDDGLFFQIVRASFSQRRKTLRNSLREVRGFWSQSTGFWEDVCREVGIDPGRRGETLSLEEFAVLSNHVVLVGGADLTAAES